MPSMTGRPGHRRMENEWRKFRAVPRSYPFRSLVLFFCTLFNRGGNRRAFRLPGAGGHHFHCVVEPSSSHIRCEANRTRKCTPKVRRNLCRKSSSGYVFKFCPRHELVRLDFLAAGACVSWILSPKRIMQNHVKSWQLMQNHAPEKMPESAGKCLKMLEYA